MEHTSVFVERAAAATCVGAGEYDWALALGIGKSSLEANVSDSQLSLAMQEKSNRRGDASGAKFSKLQLYAARTLGTVRCVLETESNE